MKKILIITGLIILVAIASGGIYVKLHNRIKAPKLPEPSLKAMAEKHNMELGNFAIATHINDQPYKEILTSQFNLAIIDNTPNWYFTDGGLRPSPTTYNFKQMDKLVAFAQKNQMSIQAHHLLWGEEKWLPNWLKNGNYTQAQLYQIMHDHIMTVATHYKGKIHEWSVVNEAFSRKTHIYGLSDWWADHTGGGTDYIDKAFYWAHQADPNAVLILNDFGNEGMNDVSNNMYNYVKSAKARGIPIDAVGMQMHIDGTHPTTKDEVLSNMRRFGDLGVKVYVTEFDVNMSGVPADQDARDNIEGGIYYDMLRACIESKNCPSFSYLGITDSETWYNYLGITGSRPLMFDTKYQPKPAYWSTRSALEQP